MRKYKFLMTVVFLFFLPFCYSQVSVTIGEASTTTLTKEKPAQIMATFPKDDTTADSWLVDGFLELKYINAFQFLTIGVVGELHKNNLVAKQQDAFQFGITAEKDFLIKGKEDINHLRIIAGFNFKHSEDKIKETKGVQSNLGFTLALEKSACLRFLQTKTRLIKISSPFANFFTLKHDHNFGLGYIGGDEKVLLGEYSFTLNLYLLSKITDSFQQPDLFQLSYTVNGRTELGGETDLDLNTLEVFSAGVNYVINEKSSVGIAFSRQSGANPYTAFSNQTFENISAKVKLTL